MYVNALKVNKMPVRPEKGETWSISNKHIDLDPRKLMKVHTMLKPSLSLSNTPTHTHILGTTTEMSLTGRFYLHYWSFVLGVFKKCFCILIVLDIDFLNDVRWNTSSVSYSFKFWFKWVWNRWTMSRCAFVPWRRMPYCTIEVIFWGGFKA